MTRLTLFIIIFLFSVLLYSCSGKPSEKDISKKLLSEYVCADKAIVNHLKILKTEETETTPDTHIFGYTITGEVEWPGGCTELGTNTPVGAKEKFEKVVTLFKDEDGNWQ